MLINCQGLARVRDKKPQDYHPGYIFYKVGKSGEGGVTLDYFPSCAFGHLFIQKKSLRYIYFFNLLQWMVINACEFTSPAFSFVSTFPELENRGPYHTPALFVFLSLDIAGCLSPRISFPFRPYSSSFLQPPLPYLCLSASLVSLFLSPSLNINKSARLFQKAVIMLIIRSLTFITLLLLSH